MNKQLLVIITLSAVWLLLTVALILSSLSLTAQCLIIPEAAFLFYNLEADLLLRFSPEDSEE